MKFKTNGIPFRYFPSLRRGVPKIALPLRCWYC